MPSKRCPNAMSACGIKRTLALSNVRFRVQQATKVELVVNLKTAKTLELSIPLPLLGRADLMIE
jgi:hypothetical protein